MCIEELRTQSSTSLPPKLAPRGSATGDSVAGAYARGGREAGSQCRGRERELAMDRTYVVTGAASGIGAATTSYLRERGARVIACDLRHADVAADLATAAGRTELVAGVTRLSGGKIDAIAAVAGGGPP